MFNGGTQTMHHGEVCFLDGGGLVDRNQQGRIAQFGGRSATAQQANGLGSSMTGNLQGVDDVRLSPLVLNTIRMSSCRNNASS